MRFKTKDLLVSVTPNLEIDEKLQAQLCIWRTRICIWPTRFCRIFTCGFGTCPLGSIGCRFGGSCFHSGCDFTIDPCGNSVWVVEDPADLVTLRDELKGVLAEVDKLQKEGLPTQLSSRSEIDAAEEALEGALAELRRQKKGKK